MTEVIKTADEAAAFLERVHRFHDGFIQELTVTSRDSFHITGRRLNDVGHQCTGEFDVRIIFAHHPTLTSNPPKRIITRCVFKNVTQIYLDLRQLKGFEWPLLEVQIEPCLEQDRLRLLCRWTKLTRENEWEEFTQCLFSFGEIEVVTIQDNGT